MNQRVSSVRVLAVDPGYDRLGLAVIEGDPSKPQVVWSDCTLPPPGEMQDRLAVVHDAVQKAIKRFHPDTLAIEGLFFSKNVKTALGVAEARGAVLAVAGLSKIPVIECSPQEVKLAVTGNGAANKAAVARMIPKLVTLPVRKRLDDELDAIAVGISALPLSTHLIRASCKIGSLSRN
jgi:crossover junction endodeoxyribonuclease RuvC